MNITSNIASAILAGCLKNGPWTPGKTTIQTDENGLSDNVEFTSSVRSTAELPSNSVNVILNSNDAETEAVYLKNAILALPALVLKSQANFSDSAPQANLQVV
jgi:hypothetical protein